MSSVFLHLMDIFADRNKNNKNDPNSYAFCVIRNNSLFHTSLILGLNTVCPGEMFNMLLFGRLFTILCDEDLVQHCFLWRILLSSVLIKPILCKYNNLHSLVNLQGMHKNDEGGLKKEEICLGNLFHIYIII